MTNLYKPTYLKELCKKYGLRPSKQYGQNYLVSEKPIQKMIEAAELDPEETVVEVGPGFGVLTLALAGQAKKVVSFEIEKKLESYWDEISASYPNIEIVWGNVLSSFDSCRSKVPDSYKVVANLPYQITSKILRLFLEEKNPPKQIVVMVQKEVAERMCAKPGDMSLLSVSVQYFGSPHIVTKVSKGSFFPSPKVDSAVVSISQIQAQPESERFFQIVRAAFSNKRKQAWKNITTSLGIEGDRVKNVLKECTGSEKIRAQGLSIAQWKEVVKKLQ